MKRRAYKTIKLKIKRVPKRRKRNRKERNCPLDDNIFLEALTMNVIQYAKMYGMKF